MFISLNTDSISKCVGVISLPILRQDQRLRGAGRLGQVPAPGQWQSWDRLPSPLPCATAFSCKSPFY